jgi:cytoskeletal protein CcmA (bactofilin family)
MDAPKTAEFAHIGKSVVIKGELSGSEDLYVDGVVEGTIQLQGNNLVVGPNGNVRAAIHAKGVVVQGKVEGDIRGTERAELRKSAVVVGDIFTQRIAIEDGAYFKGKVDVQREAARSATAGASKPEIQPEGRATAAVGAPGGITGSRGTTASPLGANANTPVTKM